MFVFTVDVLFILRVMLVVLARQGQHAQHMACISSALACCTAPFTACGSKPSHVLVLLFLNGDTLC